jgi:hypothetical protein
MGGEEYVSWPPVARRSSEPYDPRPLIRRIYLTLAEGGVVVVGSGVIHRSPLALARPVLDEIAETRRGASPAGAPYLPDGARRQLAHPEPLDSLEAVR